jgi:hypothetical protein
MLVKNLEQELEIGGGAGEDGCIGGRGLGESAENPLAGNPGALGEELEKVVVAASRASGQALAAVEDLCAERGKQPGGTVEPPLKITERFEVVVVSPQSGWTRGILDGTETSEIFPQPQHHQQRESDQNGPQMPP